MIITQISMASEAVVGPLCYEIHRINICYVKIISSM